MKKEVRDIISTVLPMSAKAAEKPIEKMTKKEREKLLKTMEKEMREAARKLEFEEAARLRDLIMEIKAQGKY